MRLLLLTALVLGLGGCAGMDAEECRTADWRAIGYEDGVLGQSPAHFGTRRRACAEHGITADFDAYLAGRTEGIGHFCRPQNGYRLGTQGQPYPSVCPAALDEAFLAAHVDGRGLYERSAKLDRIGTRLRQSRERAKEIEYLLAGNAARLMSPELEVTERITLAVELKQLTEEKIDVERSIGQLEQDHVAAETEYEDYRRHIAEKHSG